jgi:type I restriction enzyme S subunit
MSEVNLPEVWLDTSLDDVLLSIVGGGTPSKSNASYFQGSIPWMSVKDMNKNTLEDTVDHITQEAVENSSTNVIPAGTPIVATRMSLGKIVVANFDSAINQDLKALFHATGIERDYLVNWYRANSKLIESLGTGTTVKGIRLEVLRALELPLPPRAEQKVIADKLDTLLAQVEATKARLDRIPKLLKTFRQSVLAAAVSGKLTEEWRGEDPKRSIIKYLEVLHEEREKLKGLKKLKKSFGPKKSPDPLIECMPEGWEWVSFEHIAENDNNALKAGPFGSALKKSDCIESGYKVYGQEQVIAGDEQLVTYFVNNEKFQQLSSCSVKSGDILISLVGTIGKVLILSESADQGIINPRLVKLSLHENISRAFIKFYLNSPLALGFFKGFSHGGTMDILNLGILKELPIALPPIEEQTQIVSRVEELFAFADRIEQKANAALERVNNLTQSILAKAFRGELTADWRAQNPDLISGDNSAEALLAKIKAEREGLSSKKQPKKKAAPRKKA